MLIFMTLIAIICFVFVILNYNNKFIYVVSAWYITIFAMTVVGVIYISKNLTYVTPMQLDYKLYRVLHSLRIDFNSLSRIYNFLFAVFMVITVFFVMLFRKTSFWKSLFAIIPAFIFMFITDYTIKYNAYLAYYTNPESVWVYLGKISTPLGNLILWGYIIIPNILLISSFIKTRIFTMRKYLMVIGVSSLLIDLFIFSVFIKGYFSCIWFSNVDVWKIPAIPYGTGVFKTIPYALLVILLIIISLLYFFHFMNNFIIINRKKSVTNSKFLRKNLSMMLHTYKNAFVALGQQNNLAKMNMANGNIECTSDNLDYTAEFINEYLEKLEKSLKFLRGNYGGTSDINLIKCINASINLFKNDKIVFYKLFDIDCVHINADFDNIKEVFTNLFLNAIDANPKPERDTEIEIKIICENLYIMVCVKDSGKGIPREEADKIFQPFYTTKARTKAGGIGLAYVKSIIHEYNGEIRVKSEVGEFAEFQIVLPNNDRRKKKNGKNKNDSLR